jgi:hypothetical protein
MGPTVALVQEIYFLVTGIWPPLSMRTFLTATGPKTDLWLVKTVGLLLAVIGAMLIYVQRTVNVNPPIAFLAIGSAASLVVVEIVYVLKKVISPNYLGDALIEIALIIWWVIALLAA